MSRGHSGEIAGRRMTPRARRVEVTPAGCCVAGRQVGRVDAATAASGEVSLRLLIVNERDDSGQIAVGQRKCGHAASRPAGSNRWTELIAAHVFSDENGPRQVRAARAASCVAAMAEAALRSELRSPGVDLLARERLRRLRLRRPL